MTQTIKVTEKAVYGRVLVYPSCETANKFAALLVVKTFSAYQLSQIRGLGYEIECQRLPA